MDKELGFGRSEVAPSREPEHVREPAAVRPWRLFEVEVRGFGSTVVSARTRGSAIYDRFLEFTDAWPMAFGEFVKLAKARSCGAPASDGYGYIRRAYGVDVKVGQRVELCNEGASFNGRQGEVVYPGPSTAHVHIVLDGEKHRSFVHPLNIRPAGSRTASPAPGKDAPASDLNQEGAAQ